MSGPQFGRSVRAHMDDLMTDVEQRCAAVFGAIRSGKKLKKAERETLWRMLAGVCGDVECIRIWLNMGAPDGHAPSTDGVKPAATGTEA